MELEGETATTVTVPSQDGSRTKVYRVAFELPAEQIELVPTRTTTVWPATEPADTGNSRTIQTFVHTWHIRLLQLAELDTFLRLLRGRR